jgi:hypothetical protein
VLKFDAASGDAATVVMCGMVEVIVSEAVAIGDNLTVDTAGKFETAATGDYIWGVALTASAADGDTILALIHSNKLVISA